MFESLTIIELAGVLAGPSVGMFFAELGAKVIKIENRTAGGDVTRSWKLPTENSDITAYFSAINWGKKAISLDLQQPEAREIIYRLLPQADIVLTSYLPGSAQKIGMHPDKLWEYNPSLILAEINGYGEDNARAAFDAIIQAEAGFTYMNGLEENIYKMPVALVDVLAAHHLKEAVLLAYIRRLQTGEGQRVSVSLMEAAVSSLVNQATNWLVGKYIPKAAGSEHPNIVPYGTIFTTADDKKVVLAIGNDAQFAALFQVFNSDFPPEFTRNQDRVKNRKAVNTRIAAKISEWKREELLTALWAQKIPAGAVNNMQEVFETDIAQGITLKSKDLKGVKSVIAKGIPTCDDIVSPPALNQHKDEILAMAGYDEEAIEALTVKGVV